jgi:hypothetical protein
MIQNFWRRQVPHIYPEFRFVREDRGAPEFVLKNGKKWPEDGARAFESYGSIFWPSEYAMGNSRILRHELSHVEDEKKLGYFLHSILYGGFHCVFGREKNPFEAKARMAENR